jgi:hypothetical protein
VGSSTSQRKVGCLGPLLDSLGHLFGCLRSLFDPLGPFVQLFEVCVRLFGSPFLALGGLCSALREDSGGC